MELLNFDGVSLAKQQVGDIINSALAAAMAKGALKSGEIKPFVVEIPQDLKNGDYSSNVAMVNTKVFGQNPRVIATAIMDNLNFSGTFFNRAELAGPGFLNFYLSGEFFTTVVNAVLFGKDNYGRTNVGGGKRYNVEFVSANPTGPMHLGNARGGALGDILAEVLSWSGYDVTREFLVNDAGNQIEKFGLSLEARYMQLFNPDYPFED
ncbi:MAG: arginine--tRNA ligase, partial [Oscillospiraceae bacterium]